MKLKHWPTGLGCSLATESGEWEFARPNPSARDLSGTFWTASYFPKGAMFATLSGKGATITAAIEAAVTRGNLAIVPAPQLAECHTPDDVLAAAPLYERAPLRPALAF